MGYIGQKLWDIIKNKGYIWLNYGIYWARTIGYFMGYIMA